MDRLPLSRPHRKMINYFIFPLIFWYALCKMNNKCLRFLFSVPERTKTTKNNSQQPNTKWNKKKHFCPFYFRSTNQPTDAFACSVCTLHHTEWIWFFANSMWMGITFFILCVFIFVVVLPLLARFWQCQPNIYRCGNQIYMFLNEYEPASVRIHRTLCISTQIKSENHSITGCAANMQKFASSILMITKLLEYKIYHLQQKYDKRKALKNRLGL